MAESLGGIAVDEVATVPAKLLHANLLRMSYARLLHAKHEIEDYLNPGQFFGSVPMSVFAGDFLQLPPVPATTSLPNLATDANYEHRQGVAALSRVQYVYE